MNEDNPEGLILSRDRRTLIKAAKNITEATIPDGVTRINDKAFADCRSLMTVSIPNSVTEIGNYAFLGCRSLISINIPRGVARIGEYAFANCASLMSLAIPDSVTKIDWNAFIGCPSLVIFTDSDYVAHHCKEDGIETWPSTETDKEENKMRKENKYAIAFDANNDFREIRIMDDPSEPFTVDQDMRGGSVYVFTQKEFKKLIESAMRMYTDPMEEDTSEAIPAAGHAKDPYGGSIRERTLKEAKDAFKSANVTYGDGRTEGSLTGGNPMQLSLGGLDKCVTAGDSGVYYVGDLFGKGNGKDNGR